MERYGIPYKGNKSKIAKDILLELPMGKRLVDLFGGGFAITHCAVTNFPWKWSEFLYNDINPLLPPFIKDCINGKYGDGFKPEFISREEFHAKKNLDGYAKFIWSFGNDGDSYIYGQNVEADKKAGHDFVVNGIPIDGIDFKTDAKDINQRRLELNRHAKAEFNKAIKAQPELKAELKAYKKIMDGNALPIEYSLKFTKWLRSTGITAKEVNTLTGSQMSSHFLTVKSQPAIPTPEMFDRIRTSEKLSGIEIPQEIMDMVYRKEKVKEIIAADKLQHLQHLQHLEHLERLQHLEHLERLQRLQCLQLSERLELTSMDYHDYVYRDGDVVYCDIPYETGNDDYGIKFDHAEFYRWAAAQPFDVYYSSYSSGLPVWAKQVTTSLGTGNNTKRFETLLKL